MANSKALTKEEIAQIQGTLALAREGRATLVQLATAHDLAIGAVLNGCLGELRAHIHRMVSPPTLAHGRQRPRPGRRLGLRHPLPAPDRRP